MTMDLLDSRLGSKILNAWREKRKDRLELGGFFWNDLFITSLAMRKSMMGKMRGMCHFVHSVEDIGKSQKCIMEMDY